MDEPNQSVPTQQTRNDGFVAHLEHATRTVQSWPTWKQNLMGPATPEQLSASAREGRPEVR